MGSAPKREKTTQTKYLAPAALLLGALFMKKFLIDLTKEEY